VANAKGIPLPKYFGQLLQFFWNNIRPIFVDKTSNSVAYFNNDKGRPLGKNNFIKKLKYF
jgi:hypothetical protein